MPPSLERGNTNVSLASQDLLQQRKLNLHEGKVHLNVLELLASDIFMFDILVDRILMKDSKNLSQFSSV